MNGKLLLIFTLLFGLLLIAPGQQSANAADKQDVAWNLSASVMPGPPYGAQDIPGSDTASKLTVKQSNGNSAVKIIGDMNGLTPNTTYYAKTTKSYTKGAPERVPMDPNGYSGMNWHDATNNIDHDEFNTSQDIATGTFSGYDCYPTGTCDYQSDVTGTYSGNQYTITFASYNDPTSVYNTPLTLTGTIQPNGGIESNADSPIQWTGAGYAVINAMPDLFNTNIKIPVFTTNNTGSAKWTIKVPNSVLSAGSNEMAVWIFTGNNTMGPPTYVLLISDNFTITK
ncbi:MAG TPA: hypothetical protein VND99_00225 [Candidatus Acidoferrales bacterium]|nr:hypothetical protein [Candidatus Acidoferrales bacterium]